MIADLPESSLAQEKSLSKYTSGAKAQTNPTVIHFIGSDTDNARQTRNGSPSGSETSENDDSHEDYEKQADDIIDEIWRIFRDDAGWSDESKSKDGQDVVVSKTFPKWGKVFRLTVSSEAKSAVDCSIRSD
jgi:hypothetical protein